LKDGYEVGAFTQHRPPEPNTRLGILQRDHQTVQFGVREGRPVE
jgi:hypothetical protein